MVALATQSVMPAPRSDWCSSLSLSCQKGVDSVQDDTIGSPSECRVLPQVPSAGHPRARLAPRPVGCALVSKSFEDLFAELRNRAATRPEGSGTVRALDAGVHEIGKKVVEEAAEVWMAAEYQGKSAAAEEISQLLYHLQVLMISLGLELDDVYEYL